MSEPLIEEIKRRCEAGGLSCADTGDSLRIDFPRGERTRSIWVDHGWEEHARTVLSERFEDYVLLYRYSASWSPKRRVIESSGLCWQLRRPAAALRTLEDERTGSGDRGVYSSRSARRTIKETAPPSLGFAPKAV